jgi:ribosome-associated toxin RatA of RatAB toxin-antitoxin module
MNRLRRSVLIERKPADVFGLVSDPSRYPEFFTGITKWEPRSSKRRGLGAKFRVLMRVGSIEAGGTVRITDWKTNERIGWESESGVEQRGAWTIRPVAGGSELQLEIEFRLSGLFGWLAERLAGRVVERHMSATLLGARRLLEFESRSGKSRSASRSGGRPRAGSAKRS